MTTEYEQVKTLLLRDLMNKSPHELVEFRGKRMTAATAVQAMLRGEEAEFHAPATAAQQNGALSLAPSGEAIAGLSDEHRAALENGDGIDGFTRSHRPTIRTRQDDGDHGTTRVAMHWNKEGEIVPGSSGPTHQEEQPKAAIVRPAYEMSSVNRVNMRRTEEGRNDWTRGE